MKNFKFKTHCDRYYYGGYKKMDIRVFGDCAYFIPTVIEQTSQFTTIEHLLLIIKK